MGGSSGSSGRSGSNGGEVMIGILLPFGRSGLRSLKPEPEPQSPERPKTHSSNPRGPEARSPKAPNKSKDPSWGPRLKALVSATWPAGRPAGTRSSHFGTFSSPAGSPQAGWTRSGGSRVTCGRCVGERGSAPQRGGHSTICFCSTKCIRAVAA